MAEPVPAGSDVSAGTYSSGILEKLGIDPQDLAGNLGGLGEKLGL